MKTEIKLIRKDSRGLQGTIANAEHHAEFILPFIDAMKDQVAKLGFATWLQGSNVHEFRTVDGTRFTLRAFGRDRQYVGVRLALRISRSAEYRLIDIEDVEEVHKLLWAMRMMAMPNTGTVTGVMVSGNE